MQVKKLPSESGRRTGSDGQNLTQALARVLFSHTLCSRRPAPFTTIFFQLTFAFSFFLFFLILMRHLPSS